MAKLFATLETSGGKVVSISDNEQIIATVYDKNLKAYSVIIEWCNVGDPEGSEAEGGTPCYGAIVTTREWRNQPEDRRSSTCNLCSKVATHKSGGAKAWQYCKKHYKELKQIGKN